MFLFYNVNEYNIALILIMRYIYITVIYHFYYLIIGANNPILILKFIEELKM